VTGAQPKEQTKMTTYQVTYSTKAVRDSEPSFSDIVLVEAETPEELVTQVVDLVLQLGPPRSYYVDNIEGNPYETPRKKVHPRIAEKIAKDRDDLKNKINALIKAQSKP
jgi:hypothetical protein